MTAIASQPRATRPLPYVIPATNGAGAKIQVAGKLRWLKPLAILCCLVNAVSAQTFGLFTYTVYGNSITITDYPISATGVVDIPSTIDGKSVTKIGDSAFAGCVSIVSVAVPAGVTSIGQYTFYGCSSLTSVVIPAGVTSIRNYTFYGCSSLTGLSIPGGVTGIGHFTFYGCSSLTSVAIPIGPTSIGSYTFYGCSSLTSVVIPAGVKSLGEYSFSECWSLENLTIPYGVLSLDRDAFSGCWRLGSVAIPSSVTTIGISAFSDCSSLTELVIPASVSFVSTHAFQFCTNLARVVFLGNAPAMGANVFYGAKPGLSMYYYAARNGFTTPTWYGYPSVNLGAWNPVSFWLSANGFPPDTDMLSDPNNDGVSLLMAYALNLDPQLNLAGIMPKPVLSGTQMALRFYAGSEGVNYAVEVSGDLRTWTTSGVTLSAPDQGQGRTATVEALAPSRFMRLVVRQ